MKIIEKTLTRKGFLYNLVDRNDYKAIYSQSYNGNIIGYEVFRVKVIPETIMFGNTIEEHEKFPSDNDFGVTAWACRNLDKAIIRYNTIMPIVKKCNKKD